jgi:hypothetical protein
MFLGYMAMFCRYINSCFVPEARILPLSMIWCAAACPLRKATSVTFASPVLLSIHPHVVITSIPGLDPLVLV